MTSDHTPAPWFVEGGNGPVINGEKATIGIWAQQKFDAALASDDPDVEPENEKWLCGVWGDYSMEDFTNAHLIAAAPEMYQALKTLRDYLSDIHDGELWCESEKDGSPCLVRIDSETIRQDLEMVDAAIVKAEGKQ